MKCLTDPNLVLYLPLYRKDGGSQMSGEACGHTSNVTGAVWTPTGRMFDGVDDYVSITHSDILTAVNAGTVNVWFKLAALPGDKSEKALLCSKVNGGSPWNSFRFSVYEIAGGNQNKIEYELILADESGVYQYSDKAVVTDKWYMATMTWEKGENLRGYIDAELQSFIYSLSQNLYSSNSVFYIGGWGSAYSLEGTIGEVMLFNRPLTPGEISNLFLVTKWRYQ